MLTSTPTEFQRPVLVANLDAHIKGQTLKAYKPNPRKSSGADASMIYVDILSAMIFVTVGRSKGTGHFNGWQFPSFMVWFASKFCFFLSLHTWA